MATPSKDLPLGSSPPDFSLPDVISGETLTRDGLKRDGALLVMFLCRHCPYVKHVEPEVAKIGEDYEGKLGIVAVSANDAKAYPDDAPKSLAEQAKLAGFSFPYLYDETQAIARSYGAECTPEFFLFDRSGKLAYHGQLDETRPGRGAPTGKDLRAALDAVLAGKPPSDKQTPSVGCSIKWKHG